MSYQQIVRGVVTEGSPATLVARIVLDDGEPATADDISSIVAHSYHLDTSTAIDDETLVVDDVMFDTLQTDARWTSDTVGYNLAASLDGATHWPTAGEVRVELVITPESGQPITQLWHLTVIEAYSN